MEKIIYFLPILLLSGCLSQGVKTEYVKVYVEVPVIPTKPPEYPKLDLPIFHLDKNSEPKTISEAYYNSVIILLGELDKRDSDLNVYRNFKIK